MNDDSPERIVQRAYAEFIRHRDVDAVLRYFTADAKWHPVTPTPKRSTSLPIRDYWMDSGEFLDGLGSGWTVHEQNVHAHGPFVITHLRSNLGEGLMIYRLEDGKISDIWAINALGRTAPGVF
jgi:ketosteroid isomerase-like protein